MVCVFDVSSEGGALRGEAWDAGDGFGSGDVVQANRRMIEMKLRVSCSRSAAEEMGEVCETSKTRLTVKDGRSRSRLTGHLSRSSMVKTAPEEDSNMQWKTSSKTSECEAPIWQ